MRLSANNKDGDNVDLNERKRKILQAIIDEYIGTAEPVGSRAISKKQNLGLSSATIRNEMADLEEMGYLVQPHTSAGRIPSDSGYRFYVNQLMQRYQLGMEAIERLQEQLNSRVNQLDRIIRSAGLAASALTDYTTFVTAPRTNESIINKIDLVRVSEHHIMLIIVTDTVKSRRIHINLNIEECNEFAALLNREFSGKRLSDITPEQIKTAVEMSDDVRFKNIIGYFYEAIEEEDRSEIYIHNANHILKYPEYSDVEKAYDIFELLEDKAAFRHLLSQQNMNGGVNASIGKENESEILSDCSLVTVNYSLNGSSVGKLGVIGPKRMNYAKVFASLDMIAHEIDKLLNEL